MADPRLFVHGLGRIPDTVGTELRHAYRGRFCYGDNAVDTGFAVVTFLPHLVDYL